MQKIQFIQITPKQLTLKFEKLKREIVEGVVKEYQIKVTSEYLTRNEVAEMLKVDLSTVHNWKKSGKLKAYAIGTRIYFKRVEVEQSLIELKK